MDAVKDLLSYAVSVARRRWDDEESASSAGWGLVLALMTYDPSKRTALRTWVYTRVVYAVDTDRRRRRLPSSDADVKAPEVHDLPLDGDEMSLLWAHYVDRVPVCTLALRRGVTEYAVRKRMRLLVSRLSDWINE